MTRGNLVIIVERATALLSTGQLNALLADFIRLNEVEVTPATQTSIIDDVRLFHAASLGGEYYEEFRGHSNNGYDQSRGTDAFMAEFDRLVRHCIRVAKTAPPLAVREAFDLLFDVLRHIDKGNDDIIFSRTRVGLGRSVWIGTRYSRFIFGAWLRRLQRTCLRRGWIKSFEILPISSGRTICKPPLVLQTPHRKRRWEHYARFRGDRNSLRFRPPAESGIRLGCLDFCAIFSPSLWATDIFVYVSPACDFALHNWTRRQQR